MIHCHRLRPYFAPLAPTYPLDHPLKFVIPDQPYPTPDVTVRFE